MSAPLVTLNNSNGRRRKLVWGAGGLGTILLAIATTREIDVRSLTAADAALLSGLERVQSQISAMVETHRVQGEAGVETQRVQGEAGVRGAAGLEGLLRDVDRINQRLAGIERLLMERR